MHSLREGVSGAGIELFLCRVVYGKQKIIFSLRLFAILNEVGGVNVVSFSDLRPLAVTQAPSSQRRGLPSSLCYSPAPIAYGLFDHLNLNPSISAPTNHIIVRGNRLLGPFSD